MVLPIYKLLMDLSFDLLLFLYLIPDVLSLKVGVAFSQLHRQVVDSAAGFPKTFDHAETVEIS